MSIWQTLNRNDPSVEVIGSRLDALRRCPSSRGFNMSAGSGPAPGRVRKFLDWSGRHARAFIGIVIVAVVTTVVTVIIQNRDERRQIEDSKKDPLGAQVESLHDRDDPPLLKIGENPDISDPRGLDFDLVVPDPHRLPQVLPARPPRPGDDCKELWRIGVDAGGQPPTSGRYKVTFTGKYRGGDVSITELRAKIHKRNPPSDGALLHCTIKGMGMDMDQPFACDLTKSDPAICTIDEDSSLSDVGHLTMGDGDQEFIQVSVKLPAENSVEWYFEAKVIVGDEQPVWIRINSDGKTGETGTPFRSLGLRDESANHFYREYIWSIAMASMLPFLPADAGWRRGSTDPPYRWPATLATPSPSPVPPEVDTPPPGTVTPPHR